MIASHRSRRWKSGSAPLIFTASFHTTDCRPSTGFQWNFTNVDSSRRVHEPERVDAEPLHEPEGARDRAVRHRPHEHVGRLRHERHEVPEVVVRGLGLREAAVGLLLGRVDQVGELDRVLDEEHRDVVADEVPVALLRVELHREAPHVARQIERALVAGHGREADERRASARRVAGTGRRASGRRATRSSRSTRARRSRGACTTRSGMRSWSKWKIFSRKWKSSSSAGPRSPCRRVFWSSLTGTTLSSREDGIAGFCDLVGLAADVLGVAVPSGVTVRGALLVGHVNSPAFVIDVRRMCA